MRPAVLGLGRLLSIGLSTVAAAPLTALESEHHEEGGGTPVWILAVASLVLVLTGGVFAGLTIAYVVARQLCVLLCTDLA